MLLSKALNVCIWQALSAEDRVGLLSDCYALCKAKMLDLGDLMELMAEFAEEESYTVSIHQRISPFVLTMVIKVWAQLESVVMALAPLLRGGYPQYVGFAKFVQVPNLLIEYKR